MTLPITPKLRDRVSQLAAELQRRRTKKVKRFTPNSIYRVAITFLLESFVLERGDAVNSEEELLTLLSRRVAARAKDSSDSSKQV